MNALASKNKVGGKASARALQSLFVRYSEHTSENPRMRGKNISHHLWSFTLMKSIVHTFGDKQIVLLFEQATQSEGQSSVCVQGRVKRNWWVWKAVP